MSKIHQPHGRADADTAKGELRKADDYSSQPGQNNSDPDRDGANDVPPAAEDAAVGNAPREYGHSSGDRNTKHDEGDWRGYEGGTQRDATPDAPVDPGKRSDTPT